MMNYPLKIITLWAVFLLGTLFHTQLGLMPLFHGQSVTNANANPNDPIGWILWLMLGFFTIPMVIMIVSLFTEAKRYRQLHFGITVVYSILNVTHTIADLFVVPIAWFQIALMVFLCFVGLLLNWVSWAWMRERHQRQFMAV